MHANVQYCCAHMCSMHVCIFVCSSRKFNHILQSTMSSAGLNVTVIPDYRPPPREGSGELTANEFAAGSVGLLNLTCMVLGGSGDQTYSWSLQGNPTPSECSSCATPTSTTATLRLGPPLYSYYAGTYTCTVSESGRPSSGNSDSYTVTVVGECHGVCTCVCSVH